MVSGTDEHGTPIQVQADAEGLTARQLADKYNRVIVEDLQGLGLAYDLFTRTTTTQPLRGRAGAVPGAAQERLRRRRRRTMGAISPSTGRTLPDRYVEGTCPICGYDGARGDQCDNCGNQLDPADLINPRSKINGETPKFVETEHFFLDLPAFAESLGSWLSTRTDWRPNVLKFVSQPGRGPQAARDHPRPRLGRPDAARRLARPADEAALRLVRRGDRLPVGVGRVGPPRPGPGRVEAVVERPGRPGLLLHGQGQHRLPLGDLAGAAARAERRRATRAARPARSATLNLPERDRLVASS